MVGYLLKELAEEGPVELTLPVTKAVLASRLNLTPEHFSRILAELSNQRLIAVKGRKINIADAAALRRCAG